MIGQWVFVDADTWPGARHRRELCRVTASPPDTDTVTLQSQHGYSLTRSRARIEASLHTERSVKLIVIDATFFAAPNNAAILLDGLSPYFGMATTADVSSTTRVLFSTGGKELAVIWAKPLQFGTWSERTTLLISPKAGTLNTLVAAAMPESLTKLVAFLQREVAPSEDVREVVKKWRCPVESDSRPKTFLVVYDALMNDHARAVVSFVATANIAVSVKGYKRVWGKRHGTWTALGVKSAKEETLHAVALQIPCDSPPLRESGGGETRVLIPAGDVNLFGGGYDNAPAGTYNMYVPEETKNPNMHYPILMSYVDVVVSGALAISEAFAVSIFKKCDGWGCVFDDRRNVKYRGYVTVKPTDKKFVNDMLVSVRELTPWEDAQDDGGDAFLEEQSRHTMGGWDQFEANRSLVNGPSDYSDLFYTTALPVNVTAEMVARAERLSREIGSAKTMNFQHAVDREGNTGELDEIDEETLYSAVLRADVDALVGDS